MKASEVIKVSNYVLFFIITFIGTRLSADSQIECSLTSSKDQMVIQGTIRFPKGIKMPEQYEIQVLSPIDSTILNEPKYPVDNQGNFCALVEKGKISLLTASNPNDKNSFILSTIVDPIDGLDHFIIDNFSTAVALVYPTVCCLNRIPNSKVREDIARLPEILSFANVIASRDILTEESLENDDEVSTSFNKALQTAQKILIPSQMNFEATVSSGSYTTENIKYDNSIVSVEPKSLQQIFLYFPRAFASEPKFINTPIPLGSGSYFFKRAKINGFFDKAKAKVFIKSIEVLN